MTTIETLLGYLAEHGGQIVSSSSLSPMWIEQARASNRMYVDENSLGYIWEPVFETNGIPRFPISDKEIELFEWCFPLDVPIPSELSDPEKVAKWLHKRIKQ
jgi:hypothetical protein